MDNANLKNSFSEYSTGFNRIMKSVNHRGFAQAPENTLAAFRMSKLNGYDYVEADICFTAEGIPVLSHDATIDRCSNGSGTISEMTYEELRLFDFGSWKSEKFAGEPIPNFKEFLRLCKNIGLHPYIELKTNGAYTRTQIGTLVKEVERYGMKHNVTWISFNIDYLFWVVSFHKEARIGYLQGVTDTRIGYLLDMRADGADVFFDSSYAGITAEVVEKLVGNKIPLEVWTLNDVEDLYALHPYVTGVTTDSLICGKELFEKYMQL